MCCNYIKTMLKLINEFKGGEMMKFKDWLKESRLNAGLSQLNLAKELDINFVTLNNYEAGRFFPSISNLKKIADYFKVEVAELRKMEV